MVCYLLTYLLAYLLTYLLTGLTRAHLLTYFLTGPLASSGRGPSLRICLFMDLLTCGLERQPAMTCLSFPRESIYRPLWRSAHASALRSRSLGLDSYGCAGQRDTYFYLFTYFAAYLLIDLLSLLSIVPRKTSCCGAAVARLTSFTCLLAYEEEVTVMSHTRTCLLAR